MTTKAELEMNIAGYQGAIEEADKILKETRARMAASKHTLDRLAVLSARYSRMEDLIADNQIQMARDKAILTTMKKK